MTLYMNKIGPNKKNTIIKNFFQNFPWSLLLIPVFYTIQTSLIYHGDISKIALLKQLLIWEFFLSVSILLLLQIKPLQKYIVPLFFFLAILYFYFNRIYSLVSTSFAAPFIYSYTRFILCWLLACFIVLIYFRIKPLKLQGFVKWIHATCIIITIYFIVQGVFFLFKEKQYDLANYKPIVPLLKTNQSEKQLPNIYFLVPDSYTSNQVLQSQFNYNNSAIHTFLQQQGFFIADSATSNYFYSPVSIAATLNLNYLPKAAYPTDQNDLVLFSGLRLIQESNLLDYLKNKDYTIHNLSPFPIKNAISKISIHYPGSTDEDLLKLNTIESIRPFWQAKNICYKLIGQKRKTILEENTQNKRKDMQTISDYISTLSTSKTKTANFVYVHTALPHPPYVIDSTGADLELAFRTDTSHIGYVRQLAFVNSYLKKWITQIRKNDSLAIIILQGDHGFRSFPKEQNKKEAFKILNAIYFPNKNYASLYHSISSVNTFRVVLNTYFQQRLPLLKDSSYFPKF